MSETVLSQLGLYSARPTLHIDGAASDQADALLLAMTLSEQEGGLSSLTLGFANWASRGDGSAGYAFEDEQLFRLGTEVTLHGGEVDAPTELFRGKVSAVELGVEGDGPPRLTVYAEDALAKARLARRVQVYENQSVADVAREIAGRHGMTPTISGLADSTGIWFQCNESDLAFLRRLLARHGADCQVVANALHVAPRDQVQRNQVELQLHSQLYRVRAVADLAQQATEVRVTGFDPQQGQAVSGSGSSAPLGPGSGRTGAEQLRAALGEREEQVSHQLALVQSEASALAQAQFAARARGFVQVEGLTEGNPHLRVGSHVKLVDVSPRFDNTYYVTAATHRFDLRSGYQTEFTAQSAFLGQPA